MAAEARGRRTAERRGRTAETVAAWYLRLRGFGILARRVRTPAGEIDLVARRGRLLVFVEVKARPTLDAAAESLGPRQRKRLADAAAIWLAGHRHAGAIRFDVLLVAPWSVPRHIVDAFRPDA